MFKYLLKKDIFIIVFSFNLFVFTELFLGYFAWGGKSFAITKLSQKTRYIIESYVGNYFSYKEYDLLFSQQNKLFFLKTNIEEKNNFKKYLETEYENYFKKIIQIVNKNDIEILFIYIPEFENLKFDYFEKFYTKIVHKYNKPILNMKKVINEYNKDQIFLYHMIILYEIYQ